MSSRSWFSIPADSHFSLANIPFGIASRKQLKQPHVSIAIGEHILDLFTFLKQGGFARLDKLDHVELESAFSRQELNGFAELGRPVHRLVRKYLQDVFSFDTPYPDVLKDNIKLQNATIYPQSEAQMYIPMRIGDYTDFYAGKNHAYNVGVLFRGADNALQPNYAHLPVGYHGRASSIVVSGTPIRRPRGQILTNPAIKNPVFSPCRKLDFEIEIGAFICKKNDMGNPVAIDDASQHIFGYVIVNDWSARDIQAWEYVPLGPFNAKNFGTTISAWVVLADAIDPFMVPSLENEAIVLDYLRETQKENIPNLNLEATIITNLGLTATVTTTSSRNLIWSFPQMLAHHTITGCNMNVGDLLASGTISGSELGSEGSLLERSMNGKEKADLGHGISRAFLEDGDTINITGYCGESGSRIGFGDCKGKILPALER